MAVIERHAAAPEGSSRSRGLAEGDQRRATEDEGEVSDLKEREAVTRQLAAGRWTCTPRRCTGG